MKIVAIGGGNNSNIRKDGTPQYYEHKKIDQEIINLSGKSNPHILFVPHAGDSLYEFGSLNKLLHTYRDMYGCEVNLLSFVALTSRERTDELLGWSDVIYVGGGNTNQLMKLWKQYGLDKKLVEAAKEDKVLCGTSAGASCWFKEGCSDYLQMESFDENAPFAMVNGLGLVDMSFNPHGNNEKRMQAIKDLLEDTDKVGLSVTDNVAFEIDNDKYRLIYGNSFENEEQFADLCFWKDGEYYSYPLNEVGLVRNLCRR